MWNVADLHEACDRLGPDVVSLPKAAVQPGRFIATVRAAVGLGLPLALMTPPLAVVESPRMSRSYRMLALALVGMLVLVGLAQAGRATTPTSGTTAAAATGCRDGVRRPSADGRQPTPAVRRRRDGVVTDEVDGDHATTVHGAPPVTADCIDHRRC